LITVWNSLILAQRSAKEIAMCSEHILEKSLDKSSLQHGDFFPRVQYKSYGVKISILKYCTDCLDLTNILIIFVSENSKNWSPLYDFILVPF
jgi:hypothetical protein